MNDKEYWKEIMKRVRAMDGNASEDDLNAMLKAAKFYVSKGMAIGKLRSSLMEQLNQDYNDLIDDSWDGRGRKPHSPEYGKALDRLGGILGIKRDGEQDIYNDPAMDSDTTPIPQHFIIDDSVFHAMQSTGVFMSPGNLVRAEEVTRDNQMTAGGIEDDLHPGF